MEKIAGQWNCMDDYPKSEIDIRVGLLTDISNRGILGIMFLYFCEYPFSSDIYNK